MCSRSRSSQRSRDTGTFVLARMHEDCFFSQANSPIATKLAHDGLSIQVSAHPGSGCAHRAVVFAIAQLSCIVIVLRVLPYKNGI